MKILVTGGAGFIGSNLAQKLLKQNHYVFVLDNFNDFYDVRIKEKNVDKCLEFKNFSVCRGDIENSEILEKVFAKNKFDVVVHLAARAGVRPSIQNPTSYVMSNVLGTVNILEMMKKFSVPKLVMASSSSVYGNCKENIFSESLKVSEPISQYAASKLACEQFAYTYAKLFGINAVCLRFFTVYGPGQRPDLAIHKFTKFIDEGKEIQMFGDGSTIRDYTYIDDITDGIVQAINYDKTPYEIVNLGGGEPVSLKRMIQTIEKALGKKAKIVQMPMQPGDVDKTAADIAKAQALFGYQPKTDFDEGIAKFVEWYKKI